MPQDGQALPEKEDRSGLTKSISRFGRNTLDVLRTLRILNDCGTEVYFGEENIWLSRQHTKVLLSAYCVLVQAKSEDMSRDIKWGIKLGFQKQNICLS